MAQRNLGSSTEVDALTPADQQPGNVVRMPSQRLPPYSGLLIWSRATGQPVWNSIAAAHPLAHQAYIDDDYVEEGYFL